MGLEIKPGVRIVGLCPETVFALQVIEGAFRDAGYPVTVVTAGVEASHSRASFHYRGAAVDIRTSTLKAEEIEPLRAEIGRRLGPDFDIIFEATHYHIEYEPKTGVNL